MKVIRFIGILTIVLLLLVLVFPPAYWWVGFNKVILAIVFGSGTPIADRITSGGLIAWQIFALVLFLSEAINWAKPHTQKLPPYNLHKARYLELGSWVLQGGIMFLLLCLIEWKMRADGDVPGLLFNGFAHVDSLTVNQRMVSDEKGMNSFSRNYIWYDTLHHVNEQGFLARFNYDLPTIDSLRKAGKKIVFVIGDSFVEGVTSTTWDKTFIEILRTTSKKYAVCSFGIASTDPVNYRLIAEKFIPQMKPDLVIVSFCAQNDVLHFDRKPSPYIPQFWNTNAGWLDSNVPVEYTGKENVILATPQQAYNYYRQLGDLNRRHNPLAWVCKRCCLTTMLYAAPTLLKYAASEKKDKPATYRQLKQIEELCRTVNAGFEIVFIPNMVALYKKDFLNNNYKEYTDFFNDLLPHTHFPQNLHFRQDYIRMSNPHLNDSGNAKFAVFLDSIICNKLSL